jgi:predicted dehydrogenase
VLAHPDVQLVVNLTTPDAHVEVSSAAIAAGKHVWSEKPLGLDRGAIATMLEQACAAGVRVGSAPDTLLGPGFQSAKRAIAAGIIGSRCSRRRRSKPRVRIFGTRTPASSSCTVPARWLRYGPP